MTASRILAVLLVLSLWPAVGMADAATDDLGTVADFSLTDQDGVTRTLADFQGKTWVASFHLVDCKQKLCERVAETLRRLQEKFADRPDVVFVSFVLDRKIKSADKVKGRADELSARPGRWFFLFGDQAQLDALQKSFYVPLYQADPAGDHDLRLFVVDRHGHKRARVGLQGGLQLSFTGLPPAKEGPEEDIAMYERDVRLLSRHVDRLARPLPAWMPDDFPMVNAILNAAAACLLLLGYVAVRNRLVALHKSCMLTAIVVSAVFLTSYLFFHLYVQHGRATRFADRAPDAAPWVAWLYAAILLTHTILAVPVAPMALWVAWRGLRGDIAKHVRLARFVLPAWAYVSVTGVVVYAMLYRLYPE